MGNDKPQNRSGRDELGRVTKGNRLNPGGRPKLDEESKAYLREVYGPLTMKALKTLERNMDSPDGMVSNVAAREWLKKTLPDGAVQLKLEVSGPDGGPVETVTLSDEDAARRMAHILIAADKAKGKAKK